jgi:hypothetical protein
LRELRAEREVLGALGLKAVPIPEGTATDREIAETVPSMNGTEQAFRLIAWRWPNPPPNLFEADRYDNPAVAANRKEAAGTVIWKHNGRGDNENWHKELKWAWGWSRCRLAVRGQRPVFCQWGTGV